MDFQWLITVLFELVIIGLVFYVLWWALGKIAPPEPINKICQVLLVVAVAFVAIWFLFAVLSTIGGIVPKHFPR